VWTNEATDGLAGVVAAACGHRGNTKHEKPEPRWFDHQLETREGSSGRYQVAERLVVPMKPSNAGGGKGPQFKGNVEVADS